MVGSSSKIDGFVDRMGKPLFNGDEVAFQTSRGMETGFIRGLRYFQGEVNIRVLESKDGDKWSTNAVWHTNYFQTKTQVTKINKYNRWQFKK